MIKVGIIGATGYAGNELVRLLLGHKDAEIVWYGSRSYIDQKYADVYRNMFQLVDAVCMDDNMDELAKQVDVIFTATPQGLCASLVNEEILSNTKIVDLSADFRLKDVSIYEQWYKLEHKAPQYIDEAVYGLCEINRNQITKKTRIVANPGCYTTTSILTLYPMVKEGLIELIEKAASEDRHDFVRDILIRYKNIKKIYGYKLESYWSNISSVRSYYKTNMDFLKKDVRDYFFKQYPDIYSKVEDLPPAKYNCGAQVSNSLVSSGCIVNGTIENSILFKKIYIGNNSVVKNCIILNNAYIGDNSYLENCIVESGSTIKANTNYKGEGEPLILDENSPIYY